MEEFSAILREDGSVDKAREPAVDDAQLLKIYETMRLIRLVDEKCMNLQRQGRIGFYGTTTGEEAAVVGAAAALHGEDWVFPALRQSGIMLYRGFPLYKYFAHLFGNAESVEMGRSMPCHYSDRDVNVVSWSSCMATQLVHAVGAAYAAKLKQDGNVTIGFMGDGATSESDFHHALNFAGVWKTPSVFFCNNNQWAISVPISKQTASRSIAIKARAYGMPGVRLDGNDVLSVLVATQTAVARARAGDGPTLIEAVTYRINGHSTSDDPTRYRSDAEVESWRRRDPIDRFRKYLAKRGIWDDAKDAALTQRLNADIAEGVRRAEEADVPPTETLITEVYAEPTPNLRAQYADLLEAVGRDS